MYILNTKIQTNCLYSHYINLSIILLIMRECKRMEGLFYFLPTISKVNYVFTMKLIHIPHYEHYLLLPKWKDTYISCRDIYLFFLRLVLNITFKRVSKVNKLDYPLYNFVLTHHPSTNSPRKPTTHPLNFVLFYEKIS